MRIHFNKIKRNNIFCPEFDSLQGNNEIDLESKDVVIIYGPNGTGKTSFSKVLTRENKTEFSLNMDGQIFNSESEPLFHVVEDQNGRNVIKGSTEDFILGDDVKREYELQRDLELGFKKCFEKIIANLKDDFGINKKESNFHNLIENKKIVSFISKLANKLDKGKNIDQAEFIEVISTLAKKEIEDLDQRKYSFFISDLGDAKNSIIQKVLKFDIKKIEKDLNFIKVEQTDVAVSVLEKFNYMTDCLVCDTHDIDTTLLLDKKKTENATSRNLLPELVKELLNEILEKLEGNDPFKISEAISISLRDGNIENFKTICSELHKYEAIYNSKISNYFSDVFIGTNIVADFREYTNLKKNKPLLENEDIIFTQKFLNECLGKNIELKRDADGNLRLLLGDSEFLNRGRNELSLSNGEQNFLSLAFELLKAQKVAENIIVLDDPISSFDSIFKNKIAYAILQFLNKKKTILLTHSTDLVKLIEHQNKSCFNMYMLNNTPGELNGFIPLNSNEVEILIYIHQFLNQLRDGIQNEIQNEENFLIAIAPFMRGYCQIVGRLDLRDELTKLMHGYNNEKINLTFIYSQLFGLTFSSQVILSAEDIVNKSIENLSVLNSSTNFPLLNKTLKHTFTYLFLRLSVEQKLVRKFNVNVKKNDMLTKIIHYCFKPKDETTRELRAFFMSRKTLLNEFNHFEIDMNIFQPAIDITDAALTKERDDILAKLEQFSTT